MRAGAWVVLTLAVLPPSTHAQTASAGMLVQTYELHDAESVGIRDVSLVSAPFTFTVPLSTWVTVGGNGAYSHASLSLPSGQRVTASGLTDTRMSADAAWGNLTLRATALVPTGEVVRSLDEAALVGVLAADLVPFRVVQWGSGGGFGIDIAHGARVGTFTLATSLGYLGLRPSDPVDGDTEEYQPGRELHARATLQNGVRDAGVLTLAAGVQAYSGDTYGGRPLLGSGVRWDAMASYAFAMSRRLSGSVFGGIHDRGKVEPVADTLPWVPLPGTVGPSSRRVLIVGSEIHLSTRLVDVAPWIESRLVRSGEARGQGWLASLGARASYRIWGGRFARRLTLHPTAAYRFGRTEPEPGLVSAISGWEVGLTGSFDPGP